MMDEFQSEFLEEAQYLLEACEESFLSLEESDDKLDDLNSIFRVAHSVKGAGAAVGFTDLSGFAHKFEDLLALLRIHPEFVTKKIVDVLLEANDAIKQKVSLLASGSDEEWKVHGLTLKLTKLTELLSGQQADSAPSHIPAVSQDTPAETTTENKEEIKEEKKSQPEAPKNTNIKVETGKVDTLLSNVGELVVIKSQLLKLSDDEVLSDNRWQHLFSNLDMVVRSLQDQTLSLRLTPVKPLFTKMKRIVRELSLKLCKEVEFELIGESTELDRSLIDLLADPLMHIVRNAMDHGLEGIEERLDAGKPGIGTLKLTAFHEGGNFCMHIQDDGKGIEKSRILQKAEEKGLVDEKTAQHLSDEDIYQYLFHPGFSTAKEVTDVSGRGVGLDVVKSNLEKMSGEIVITSKFGEGTTFKIQLPLTTGITDAMVFAIKDEYYFLPSDSISEIVTLDSLPIDSMPGDRRSLFWRDQSIPLLNLNNALNLNISDKENVIIVVKSKDQNIAFGIERVVGQSQLVIRSMDDKIVGINSPVCGAAIMGDGKVGFLLNANNVLKISQNTEESITAA